MDGHTTGGREGRGDAEGVDLSPTTSYRQRPTTPNRPVKHRPSELPQGALDHYNPRRLEINRIRQIRRLRMKFEPDVVAALVVAPAAGWPR